MRLDAGLFLGAGVLPRSIRFALRLLTPGHPPPAPPSRHPPPRPPRRASFAPRLPPRFAPPRVAPARYPKEKLFTLLDLCVSSLRRGHANLLCIVPILTDDSRRRSKKTLGRSYLP